MTAHTGSRGRGLVAGALRAARTVWRWFAVINGFTAAVLVVGAAVSYPLWILATSARDVYTIVVLGAVGLLVVANVLRRVAAARTVADRPK
ncbi:MAG: hypothetical protein ACOC2Y_02595 [Spirochaetota bacterium]